MVSQALPNKEGINCQTFNEEGGKEGTQYTSHPNTSLVCYLGELSRTWNLTKEFTKDAQQIFLSNFYEYSTTTSAYYRLACSQTHYRGSIFGTDLDQTKYAEVLGALNGKFKGHLNKMEDWRNIEMNLDLDELEVGSITRSNYIEYHKKDKLYKILVEWVSNKIDCVNEMIRCFYNTEYIRTPDGVCTSVIDLRHLLQQGRAESTDLLEKGDGSYDRHAGKTLPTLIEVFSGASKRRIYVGLVMTTLAENEARAFLNATKHGSQVANAVLWFSSTARNCTLLHLFACKNTLIDVHDAGKRLYEKQQKWDRYAEYLYTPNNISTPVRVSTQLVPDIVNYLDTTIREGLCSKFNIGSVTGEMIATIFNSVLTNELIELQTTCIKLVTRTTRIDLATNQLYKPSKSNSGNNGNNHDEEKDDDDSISEPMNISGTKKCIEEIAEAGTPVLGS